MKKKGKEQEETEEESAEETEEETEEESAEETEEEQPKKKTEKWVAQDIPTQTEPMVVNTKEEKVYSQAAINAAILNKLDRIEKALLE